MERMRSVQKVCAYVSARVDVVFFWQLGEKDKVVSDIQRLRFGLRVCVLRLNPMYVERFWLVCAKP